MTLNFEQLKSMVVFAQVVEQGSLTAAAKHIGLSRAVVSYHIKKLESQLGVKLLNRSTRSIALTEAGSAYYQSCRIIAEQAATANQQIENLKNEPVGLLKITCPVNVGLQMIVPALNNFRRLYPKIELDIMLTDEVVNIMQEGIDLAIRGAPLSDSGLQASKLSTLATCLCGSPDYLKKRGRPSTPAELGQHDWVIYKLTSGAIKLSKGSRSYSIAVTGSITTNNAAARTAFIEGGHGLGRIPVYDAWPKIQAGSLELVLEDYQLSDINVYGVFPPGSAKSKKLRLLIDYLKDYFVKVDRQTAF
ncbi:LysR family transcriptional regulator [Endozoicomonas sp. SM1973]|uniref:LysR family transcriptional regulator n=1 Tax=Spartinivicinus marinus TaxID=2994442 RepID=A0A853IEX0_9GAMM|nr:LysR family transcriptional regulator [Spartinivicinus marinus]MCX4028665.1 LysR family transcriptional regulator [Spartinivicinus marinus]NYZ69078.1 LysR family transcriptional regulator [Spartinivicinus marinus]